MSFSKSLEKPTNSDNKAKKKKDEIGEKKLSRGKKALKWQIPKCSGLTCSFVKYIMPERALRGLLIIII